MSSPESGLSVFHKCTLLSQMGWLKLTLSSGTGLFKDVMPRAFRKLPYFRLRSGEFGLAHVP